MTYKFFLLLVFSKFCFAKALYQDEPRKTSFNFSIKKSFVEQSTGDRAPYIGSQVSFHHPIPGVDFLDGGFSLSYLFANTGAHPRISVEVSYFHLLAPLTISYNYFFRYYLSLEPGLCIERSRAYIVSKYYETTVKYFVLKSSFGFDYAINDFFEIRTGAEVLFSSWHSNFDFSYLFGLQLRI